MKTDPLATEAGIWKRSSDELREITHRLLSRVAEADKGRASWLNRQREYYLRRYVKLFRDTIWPWPGASDVVMPTIDMTIDRMKATLYRVIFTNPMVVFEARNAVSQLRARSAEIFFRWLLDDGMPTFRREITIGLDTILQYGHVVHKIFWDYQTRNATKILRRTQLPLELQRILSADLQAKTPLAVAIEKHFRGKLDEREFRSALLAQKAEVKEGIAKRFLLDPQEPVDVKAIETIFTFLVKGEEEAVYKTKEILYDAPRVTGLNPEDFIVPRGTCDIQSAPWLANRVYLSESTFKQRADDRGWSSKAIKKVLDNRRLDDRSRHSDIKRTLLDTARDQREGMVSTDPADLIELVEIYWHEDIDNDGRDEIVFMPVHFGTETPLSDPRELLLDHGKYPFAKIDFELNDPRFYSSRGVPEKIDDIDIEITKRHRNKLNNLDLMVPTFKYRMGSGMNPDNMRFRPGDAYPVMNMDDFDVIQVPDRTFPDEREENILLTWNQRYLGGLDTGLAGQQNIHEARTATEIQAIQRSASENLSFKAAIMQLGMKEVYGQVWDLWNQFGDRRQDVYLRITGEQMEHLTVDEIRGDYSIVPVGTISTTDNLAEAQRALARLNVLLALKEKFGEFALGDQWDIDIAAAVRLYLTRDNFLDAETTIRRRSDEEIQAVQARRQQLTDLTERLEANVPISVEEQRAANKLSAQKLPHGQLQRIAPRSNGR